MVMCGAMSTGFFPGQAAFSGPVVGLGAPPETSFAGQAHFSGCLVATTWPRADAERLLPPELELAPNTSGTPAIHPVLFSFGDQLQGSFLLGGVPIEAGPTYREFCVIVPFVRRRGGGRNLHLYCPRLYSTSYPAYWHGNMSYGLRKAMAGMGWEGSTFVVTSPDGGARAHADVERTADWRPPADTDLPGFDALRAAFALPIAGRRDDGTLVSSYFRWELEDMVLRPVAATVSVDAPLSEGCRPGRWTGLPGATFEVRGMLWRITWPMACRF